MINDLNDVLIFRLCTIHIFLSKTICLNTHYKLFQILTIKRYDVSLDELLLAVFNLNHYLLLISHLCFQT